jgi:hypothetical protein
MSWLLRIFRRPDYTSDITQFIDELKAEKPDLEARQRAGRSLWWDKHLDLQALKDWRPAGVPATPYAYATEPSQK